MSTSASTGWLSDFTRHALAGNRAGVNWSRFVELFGMPHVVAVARPRTSRYWQRRAEWSRRFKNKRRRRMGRLHICALLTTFAERFPHPSAFEWRSAEKGPR